MKVYQLLPKHVQFFRNGVHMKCRWLFRIIEDTINLTAGEKLFGKCNFNTDTVQCCIQGKYYPILKRKGSDKFSASKNDGASMTFMLKLKKKKSCYLE
jgi:hypothetical protein